MELTTEALKQYIGGQLEVQNTNEGYLYRGEISDVSVENNELRVRLAWNAKLEGYPDLSKARWVKDNHPTYAASLEIYSISNIGENRICLYSSIIGETTVLFPKDGSKLERSHVKDLEAQV